MTTEDWRERAECRGHPTSWWYPDLPSDEMDDGTVGPTEHLYERAKEICQRCPVQSNCLSAALQSKEKYGMWGSCAPIGRLRIERKHRRSRRLKRIQNEEETGGDG